MNISIILITLSLIFGLILIIQQIKSKNLEHFSNIDSNIKPLDNKIDQILHSNVTCPFQTIKCRKLCNNKIQVEYAFINDTQINTEIFDNENEFSKIWIQLEKKYPVIARCVNPLTTCQIDQCSLTDSIIKSPDQNINRQPINIESTKSDLESLAQLNRDSINTNSEINRIRQLIVEIQDRLNKMTKIPKQLDYTYQIKSDRNIQQTKINQQQLVDILNNLIYKKYIKPEDYPKIIDDFKQNTQTIENFSSKPSREINQSNDHPINNIINLLKYKLDKVYLKLIQTYTNQSEITAQTKLEVETEYQSLDKSLNLSLSKWNQELDQHIQPKFNTIIKYQIDLQKISRKIDKFIQKYLKL